MFRYKSNKQALIIAAVSVLLCLTNLTGATYALFTSDRQDGTIGIVTTSGNVEVDIVDTAGDTLMGRYLNFIGKDGETDVLFEPGATFATQGFKVKNTGDIPVNFKLSVGKDNVVDINGKAVDIEKFNEAFEIWIVEQKPGEALDLRKAIELPKFEKNLTVGFCSESTYYLVVKMKESAGNEFQNQSYAGIGVTVYAVQGNVDIKE